MRVLARWRGWQQDRDIILGGGENVLEGLVFSFWKQAPGDGKFYAIGVEKKSLASALGAQNVERCFALSVLSRRIAKSAFNVGGRLKI